jgi:hypothetical protein
MLEFLLSLLIPVKIALLVIAAYFLLQLILPG